MSRLLAAVVATFALAACGLAAAAPPETASDVELYLTELERIHPEPYHAISKAEYRAAADRLIARLPELDDDELMVELLRLVALLGERDGHANMNPLADGTGAPLHLYPLATYEFADGVYVVAAPGRPQLVGRKLVAIDGKPIADVLALVDPLVTYDNALSRAAHRSPYLVVGRDPPRARDHAHRCARRVLGRRRGRRRAHARRCRRVHQRAAAGLSELPRRDAEARQAAASSRSADTSQWLTTIDRDRVVYFAYNTVQGYPDARSRTGSLRLARRPKTRRVIIDLRNNGGGDINTYAVPAPDAEVARDQQAREARRADRTHDVLRRGALRRRPEARHARDLHRRADRRKPEPLQRHRPGPAARQRLHDQHPAHPLREAARPERAAARPRRRGRR